MVREAGRLQWGITFPIVSVRIHHHTLHRRRGVVAFTFGRATAVILGDNDAAPVRVQENFAAVKAHSPGRIERPLHSIAVDLPRLPAWHEHMPVVVGAVGGGIQGDHARGPGVILPVKEQQLHACRASGEQTEIHATVSNRGAKRTASARCHESIHGRSILAAFALLLFTAEPAGGYSIVPRNSAIFSTGKSGNGRSLCSLQVCTLFLAS